MLDNVITLSVDETKDGATTADVDHTYSRYDTYNARSIFHDGDHLPDMRKELTFYRTSAKSNGNFRGVQKSAAKFTTDISVVGVDSETTVIAPIIFEISASIPLGATEEQVVLEQQKVAAALADASLMVDLNVFLSI